VAAQARSPRVTVLIACYNDGATLEDAVESAFAQDDVELVVVDDGSTDRRTLEVFDGLERRGVVVVHRENGGRAAARMTGLEVTSAPYVTYVDADDLVPPGALSALADALDADPGLAVVWGDLELFGDVTYRDRKPDEIDPWVETHKNELPGPGMFRRTELIAAGGWQLAIGYEDWDLWMTLAERGCRGRRVPLVAYRYRTHGDRGWRAESRRHREIVAELRRRHPALFARRRQNWIRSKAPWRVKLGLPLLGLMPLPTRLQQAMANALIRPRFVLRAAVAPRFARSRRALRRAPCPQAGDTGDQPLPL
jgi:glycosyltransferase involved in cell wall biosynthesis